MGRRKREFNWLYKLGLAGAMWDRKSPDRALTSWIRAPAAGTRPRALDLGCGTGTHATYLARCGYEVDAVDFSPPALVQARSRAQEAGLRVRFVLADALTYTAVQPYDVVLDYGCFHNLGDLDRQQYAHRVGALTAAGGQFVLMAFAPRYRVDWRLMGPYHLPQTAIHSYFADRFEILDQVEAQHYWEQVPALLRPLAGPYRAHVYRMRRRPRRPAAKQWSAQ